MQDLSRLTATPRPLHGLPIGVKDVIDIAGMPTESACDARQVNPGINRRGSKDSQLR
jgi:Asp-tRNA(Asn)/Glu-tRNA(Gln) amidotransferase A subunit family amidase